MELKREIHNWPRFLSHNYNTCSTAHFVSGYRFYNIDGEKEIGVIVLGLPFPESDITFRWKPFGENFKMETVGETFQMETGVIAPPERFSLS